ncbi:holin lysis mediator [Pectobacterium phage POP12]|nr:holin lysis mediator [Pectobacterium phage POP12]
MADNDTKVAILDRIVTLLTSIKTWKQAAIKLFLIFALFLMALTWYKWDDVYKFLSTPTVKVLTEVELNEKFIEASKEQLQIVHLTSGADFSAVFAFRPKNINYFVDVVAYSGKLPEMLHPDNLGGFPINKTSEEYTRHISGLYYESKQASVYFPTREKIDVDYTFSCPYFNMDNSYSGSILMEWYTKKPAQSTDSLNTLCGQSARILGRTK